MSVIAGYVVPHPPLIVPEVGRGEERKISRTVAAYRAVASEIAAHAPETIVLVSPHAPAFSDYIHISPGSGAKGSLSRFGAPAEYAVEYDEDYARALEEICGRESLPAGGAKGRDQSLDHGTLIPLHFIGQKYADFKLVRIGISALSLEEHYRFGEFIAEAASTLGRGTVVVASGDLSHRLREDGPYGFAPESPQLDRALTGIMETGDFGALFKLDPMMCENAGECGLRPFAVMAGALGGRAVTPILWSYEGPFGVGYALASFNPADPYVGLARDTLERYVREGKRPALPEGLPEELLNRRAGVFVSLKKRRELRGCIGTIGPVQDNIALEIAHNAISSGTEDPRFPPVRPDELGELVYSVDVLSPPEPVADKSSLDVKRYGVIVSKGYRRGLLLPNLEGVDSVDEQLEIACRKAGIDPRGGYGIERFEVVRHT